MSQAQNVVNSSLKAASLNMMTQIMFRLITFFMNAFVLRHISRDVLGLIYVRLNLLDDTIIFLSTEGFRLAGLGHNRETGDWQKTVNLLWLTVPASALWSAALGWAWCYWLPAPPPHLVDQVRLGQCSKLVSCHLLQIKSCVSPSTSTRWWWWPWLVWGRCWRRAPWWWARC